MIVVEFEFHFGCARLANEWQQSYPIEKPSERAGEQFQVKTSISLNCCVEEHVRRRPNVEPAGSGRKQAAGSIQQQDSDCAQDADLCARQPATGSGGPQLARGRPSIGRESTGGEPAPALRPPAQGPVDAVRLRGRVRDAGGRSEPDHRAGDGVVFASSEPLELAALGRRPLPPAAALAPGGSPTKLSGSAAAAAAPKKLNGALHERDRKSVVAPCGRR